MHFNIVSTGGRIIYSEVSAFLEKKSDMILKAKSISTWNKTLTLTRNHLVYARKKFYDEFNPM